MLRGASPFYAVAFDRSGTLLAGAEQNGTTVVWDTKSWKQILILGAASGLSVNAVAFAPDGSRIATAGISGVVMLWDLRGRLVSKFEAGTTQDGVTINAIAFSPDGTRLAAACSDRTVRLWSLSGKPGLVALTGHSGPVRAVAFSPDSELLVSADDDGAIRLWNGHSGARLGTLPGSGTQQVDALAFNRQGTLLASGGGDGVVRLWDTGTRVQAEALTGPSSRVTGLAFSHRTGHRQRRGRLDGGIVECRFPAAAGHQQHLGGSDRRRRPTTHSDDRQRGSHRAMEPGVHGQLCVGGLADSAGGQRGGPRGHPPVRGAQPGRHRHGGAAAGKPGIALWSTRGGLEIGKGAAPQPLTASPTARRLTGPS